MDRTRSTSPPKSACPGVSTILIWYPFQLTAVFFARIVIPRSFSWSLESMMRSEPWSRRSSVPDCSSNLSTKVVLPWSTWATIATFLNFSIISLLQTAATEHGHNTYGHYFNVAPKKCSANYSKNTLITQHLKPNERNIYTGLLFCTYLVRMVFNSDPF